MFKREYYEKAQDMLVNEYIVTGEEKPIPCVYCDNKHVKYQIYEAFNGNVQYIVKCPDCSSHTNFNDRKHSSFNDWQNKKIHIPFSVPMPPHVIFDYDYKLYRGVKMKLCS
jgi:hypothetical protein